ncbi:DUF4105 domain-containing protein [Rhodohalobacter sp. SW132]|uniref:Lnb N-terminal periplasmic domain-containing protein n=1 Tax=Rhodohalobacter sp. SW132 TaxID=2293433 RepID=UPI0013141785|nr:DUF4105 domain-containing protein [Rhodohalobacter sp. SW132]
MKLRLFITLILLSLPLVANGQAAQLSDQAEISLITILPGETPEELFGHSAVRVNDPANNIDISYNYGTFHFDDYFLLKFIYGDLEYFLSEAPFPLTVRHYRERQRPMYEQVLNLTQQQKQDLHEFLIVNIQEENRYYQYDFLYDNCSTRIQDALEDVLGDDLRFHYTEGEERTFRELIHLYADPDSFNGLGIDLLLGSTIDIRATSRQHMFLPDFLMMEFDNATVLVDGEMQPLVATTTQPLQLDDYEQNPGRPIALIFTWILFIAGAIVTFFQIRKNRYVNLWLDLPLFGTIGLIGLLIVFLWFFSLHTETVRNLNLFWAWPFHLLILPFLIKRTTKNGVMSIYFTLYAAVCLLILAGWWFWTQQLNSAIIPILLLLSLRAGCNAYSLLPKNWR